MKKLFWIAYTIFLVTSISVADSMDDFVDRFYTEVLERPSDIDGHQYWVNQLRTGRSAGEDIAKGFVFSDEYTKEPKDNTTYLQTLYRAFFDRNADNGGLNYWLELLDNGESRENVLSDFLRSQEFLELSNQYGIIAVQSSDPIDRFVSRFYSEILERIPDSEGHAQWSSQLRSGQASGEDIARSFVFSAEYSTKDVDNETYVKTLYKAFFDRDADQAGLSHWLALLVAGESEASILSDFLDSQEFTNLANEYGIVATYDNGNADDDGKGSTDDGKGSTDDGKGSTDDVGLHNQGRSCAQCHSGDFQSGATVFKTLNASDNTLGAVGFKIKLDNLEVFSSGNGAGNSYLTQVSSAKFTAHVINANGNIVNSSLHLSHDRTRLDCNRCHTQNGSNGAPGRITNFSLNTTPDPVTPTPDPVTPTPDPVTPVAKTFAADVMTVLNAKCKSCHGSNGNFTITTTNATYTNIATLKTTATAAGQYLLDKGSNAVVHGGGSVIPTTGVEYQSMKSWVDAGALNN